MLLYINYLYTHKHTHTHLLENHNVQITNNRSALNANQYFPKALTRTWIKNSYFLNSWETEIPSSGWPSNDCDWLNWLKAKTVFQELNSSLSQWFQEPNYLSYQCLPGSTLAKKPVSSQTWVWNPGTYIWEIRNLTIRIHACSWNFEWNNTAQIMK